MTEKPTINILCLSSVDPKGSIWDKHRANTDKVSEYYAGADSDGFNQYGDRLKNCATRLEFGVASEDSNGLLNLKLSDARFCRVRHCPICQWRRSLMWKAKAYKILPDVLADYPKARWLFITLTVKNCHISDLRATLNDMNRAFKRLTELKAWPAQGWIKSVEVTRGQDGGSAHPHFHVLAMVRPSYFSYGYLSHAKWVALWQQCLRIDYSPVLHVSAIAKHDNAATLIPEILKYQVKESDLVADKEWFLELTRQMHRSRAIAVGGVLRQYMQELELGRRNLVDKAEETDETEEGRICCKWRRGGKKYKIEG